MLAYSSIAHSGYMLAGLVATQSQVGGGLSYAGSHTLLYYAVAYALMNTGAFAVVMLVERYRSAVDLEAYRGLGRSSPALALAMAVFMLSLIGVPPTAGFFGKLPDHRRLGQRRRHLASGAAGAGSGGFGVLLPAGGGKHVHASGRSRRGCSFDAGFDRSGARHDGFWDRWS